MHTVSFDILNGGDLLEDLGVAERIILKYMLK
jgi:hypothetical protein